MNLSRCRGPAAWGGGQARQRAVKRSSSARATLLARSWCVGSGFLVHIILRYFLFLESYFCPSFGLSTYWGVSRCSPARAAAAPADRF